MDPAKTQAVTLWPTPTGRKELQRFLGFANFYRWFICNYSSVVQPLTALTSMRVPFQWTLEAEVAFSALKTRFSTAPVLIMADPERQFVLEVDALDTGVGVVLSQRGGDDKVHSCAFSHRLSPAERNYPIWDRELMALNGATSTRAQPSLSWFGLITEIWSTSARPSFSTLGRPSGPYSSAASVSPSPTARAAKT